MFGKYEGQGEGNFEVGSLSVRSHPPDVEKFDLPLVRHGHAQCHDLALGKWPSYWLGDEVFLDFDGNELRTLEAAYKYSQDTGNDVFVWHEVLKVIRDRGQRPNLRESGRLLFCPSVRIQRTLLSKRLSIDLRKKVSKTITSDMKWPSESTSTIMKVPLERGGVDVNVAGSCQNETSKVTFSLRPESINNIKPKIKSSFV